MLNHEYLPLEGMKLFTEGCTRLLLGDSSPAITHNRVSVVSSGVARIPRATVWAWSSWKILHVVQK